MEEVVNRNGSGTCLQRKQKARGSRGRKPVERGKKIWGRTQHDTYE